MHIRFPKHGGHVNRPLDPHLFSKYEHWSTISSLLSQELQPPPDIPGADRTELLRLLSHRQAEVTRFTSEWENLSERLERTSSAKSELQTRIDSLVGQEASVRLREQLLSQEMSLLRQQNDMLSHEVENLSNELLSVRKDKVTVVSALEVAESDELVSASRVALGRFYSQHFLFNFSVRWSRKWQSMWRPNKTKQRNMRRY